MVKSREYSIDICSGQSPNHSIGQAHPTIVQQRKLPSIVFWMMVERVQITLTTRTHDRSLAKWLLLCLAIMNKAKSR